MTLIKVKNPKAIDFMEGLLRKEEGSDIDVGEVLKGVLINDPDSIFILQAWEGEDLQAFIVAFAPASVSYTYIQDIWVKEDVDPSIVDRMFFKTIMWTEAVDRSFIRLEYRSSIDQVLINKWRLSVDSMIYKFDVNSLEDLLIEKREVVETQPEPPQEDTKDVFEQVKDIKKGLVETANEVKLPESSNPELLFKPAVGLPDPKSKAFSRAVEREDRRAEGGS